MSSGRSKWLKNTAPEVPDETAKDKSSGKGGKGKEAPKGKSGGKGKGKGRGKGKGFQEADELQPTGIGSSPKMADTCDLNEVYQLSVQSPKQDVSFFETVFRKLRNRQPLYLREDFCGTANICRAWVDSNVERFALGVDLDKKTLLWGLEHNIKPSPSAVERIKLVCANVLDEIQTSFPQADITFAFNYSICYMKTRKDLLRYFAAARKTLAEDGIFVCDLYGGTEAIKPRKCIRRVGETPYKYTWEQASFNPITSETQCYLSFHFPDKSSLHHAFSYDWRLWSVAEVKDVLLEVGFKDVQVWWAKAKPGVEDESDDSDADGHDDENQGESNSGDDDDDDGEEDGDESDPEEELPSREQGRYRSQGRQQHPRRQGSARNQGTTRPKKSVTDADESLEDQLQLVRCPPQTPAWNVNIVAIQ